MKITLVAPHGCADKLILQHTDFSNEHLGERQVKEVMVQKLSGICCLYHPINGEMVNGASGQILLEHKLSM